MDAANVDLKAFSETFYGQLCGGQLGPVLETLEYLKHETSVWFEITTLLIPGENDSDAELQGLTQWVVEHLGVDVPLHFTAFHPDWKMRDHPSTSKETLRHARQIAYENGMRYVYTGNVHDQNGNSTFCHQCSTRIIGRDWYNLTRWGLTTEGTCGKCGALCSGVFDASPGTWGSKRLPVQLGRV
jgi:pyruvate formate lyase activating enzyme